VADIINIADLLAQRIQALTPADLAELLRRQDDGDIIGVDEAAAELGVHPNSLRRAAVAWGVPHRRMGTEWRFSRKRLREWVRSGKTTPQ